MALKVLQFCEDAFKEVIISDLFFFSSFYLAKISPITITLFLICLRRIETQRLSCGLFSLATSSVFIFNLGMRNTRSGMGILWIMGRIICCHDCVETKCN